MEMYVKKLKSLCRPWRPSLPAITPWTIRLHNHPSINFGDHLSIYIAQKMSKLKACSVVDRFKDDHFLITGSITSEATERSILWGVGIAFRHEELNHKPKKTIMVRGKYTNALLKQNGFDEAPVLGDPAYILNKIYSPVLSKKYRLGIIAHWVDEDIANKFRGNDKSILVITLMRPTEEVINDILSCEVCVSSSLHGIIASHAYAIPCLWVQFSNKIIGDGTKFLDYFSSVGIDQNEPVEVTDDYPINKLTVQIPSNTGNHEKAEEIYNSCPFLK